VSSVKGFAELKQTTDIFSSGLETVIIRTLEDIARRSTQNIKQNAPVDTGFMRNSVVMDKPGFNIIRIRANAEYSIYVDKGHETVSGTTVPPNPFFTKEIQRLEDGELIRIVLASAKSFINK
jgi:hypothetical protein